MSGVRYCVNWDEDPHEDPEVRAGQGLSFDWDWQTWPGELGGEVGYDHEAVAGDLVGVGAVADMLEDRSPTEWPRYLWIHSDREGLTRHEIEPEYSVSAVLSGTATRFGGAS